jgi:ribonuclease HIII
VTQETLVVQIPAAERDNLRRGLSSGVFEFRSVPHAVFSVKGEGVVATLYRSGKLVVQGSDPGLFVERFAAGVASPTRPARPKAKPTGGTQVSTRTTVGSDETGKGDYFGPLVVCAARVEVDQGHRLKEAGVADSKRISDGRALQLGAWLRREVPHSLQVLMPAEYDRAWNTYGLNTLLSRQHAAAIREVARPGDRTVIDQFSKQDEIGPLLADLALEIELRPRAESEVAVAAASILARSEFLVCLRELSQRHDLELPKGAGPAVDEAGAAFVREYGFERLSQVAKVHFRNTEKIRELLAEG